MRLESLGSGPGPTAFFLCDLELSSLDLSSLSQQSLVAALCSLPKDSNQQLNVCQGGGLVPVGGHFNVLCPPNKCVYLSEALCPWKDLPTAMVPLPRRHADTRTGRSAAC